MTRELVSFKAGLKPAILVGVSKRRDPKTGKRVHTKTNTIKQLIEMRYPYIFFSHRGVYLFFQTTPRYTAFLKTLHTVLVDGVEYQDYKMDNLGLALGYPPIAVDYFQQVFYLDEPLRVMVTFYGITFMCHPDMADQCVEWCNQTYEIPSALKDWGSPITIKPFGNKSSGTLKSLQ